MNKFGSKKENWFDCAICKFYYATHRGVLPRGRHIYACDGCWAGLPEIIRVEVFDKFEAFYEEVQKKWR